LNASVLAVIVVVPAVTAVTSPEALTVATEGVVEVQFTPLVMFCVDRCFELPVLKSFDYIDQPPRTGVIARIQVQAGKRLGVHSHTFVKAPRLSDPEVSQVETVRVDSAVAWHSGNGK
jgi:hypothetical protein